MAYLILVVCSRINLLFRDSLFLLVNILCPSVRVLISSSEYVTLLMCQATLGKLCECKELLLCSALHSAAAIGDGTAVATRELTRVPY